MKKIGFYFASPGKAKGGCRASSNLSADAEPCKAIASTLLVALVIGAQFFLGGCSALYYTGNAVAAQFTETEAKTWVVRLSNEQTGSGDRVSGYMFIEGGFAQKGPKIVDVSPMYPMTFSRPFKGEAGAAFMATTPMRMSMSIHGRPHEVRIPLPELVTEPVQGEFLMDITPKTVTLRLRPYTGLKEWSPGTGNVSWALGDYQSIFEGMWRELK